MKVSVSESAPLKKPPNARKVSISVPRRDSTDNSVSEHALGTGILKKKDERPSVLVESPENSRRASMAGVAFMEVWSLPFEFGHENDKAQSRKM